MTFPKTRYTASPASFLQVMNIKSQRQKFIKGNEVFPVFRYDERYAQENLRDRFQSLEREYNEADADQRDIIQRRLKETSFLLISQQLQHATLEDIKRELLEAFRSQTKDLYGEPRRDSTIGILVRLRSFAKGHDDETMKSYWSYIERTLDFKDEHIPYEPSSETVAYYHGLLARYAPWIESHDNELPHDPIDLLTLALRYIGASQNGWGIEERQGGSNLRVAYARKRIIKGHDFSARSFLGLKQVVVHEAYGHVNRFLKSGGRIFHGQESEGLAVVLEQLLYKKYTPKRSLRYLAIALGWGTLGEPMDFRQVYEIIWRAKCILSKCDEAYAKERAFNECVRAFRGGRPDIQGAVFTKDIMYYDGNIDLWRWLEYDKLSYEEFVALLEGQRKAEI